MVRGVGMNAKTYPSAEAFLDQYHESPVGPPKCMVLDVRLPGLSGLGLQKSLADEGRAMPIIMMSGCADIPTAVQAISAGAMDFLEKPFSGRALLARIQQAIDQNARQQLAGAHQADLTARVEKLTMRQREVLDLLLKCKRSKEIANHLGIGEKTVAKHRAIVLDKMQVESVVELIRLFVGPSQPHKTGIPAAVRHDASNT
jgi:FixJ family two-component response regulator